MKNLCCVMLSVSLVLAASVAWAGTATDIRVPPVSQKIPGAPSTGPTVAGDPTASQGQWFLQNGITDGHSARTHEFYDNRDGDGGSALKSTLAIEGYVQNIDWQGTAGSSAILGFEILASITNDLSLSDPTSAALGDNSHGERIREADAAWYNERAMMYDTKLTAEFAIDGSKPSPGDIGPYKTLSPAIVALNHDQLAWYCWTEDWDNEPQGDFQIPTWDFGDIVTGMTATKVLQFTIDDQVNGLQDTDTDHRWDAIVESEANDVDILLNRSTSLKVSNWVDALTTDTGGAYPQGAMASSDSSVFFNTIPEPATVVNLGLGAMMLLGLVLRRRAKK